MLLSTDDCAVDPNGACVSMASYEAYLANRQYYEPRQRYFPSSDYSYCSANDSICAACTSQWTSNYDNTGSTGLSTYCTGSDGCVCIADCVVSNWEATVLSDQCSSSDSSSGGGTTSMTSRIVVSVFVGVGVALLLAFATWGVKRFVRRSNYQPSGEFQAARKSRERGDSRLMLRFVFVSDASRANPNRPPPRPQQSGPQLNLTGWKSLREKLIETENGFITGESVTLDTRERAETFTETDTPAIRLEEGEGYRPASPSELERRGRETTQL
ncbi:hypothetical protein BBJ28_00001022 [Nothophytophthora sp. Chile5]|nr:hypothetical protein BBJ28_00001022 [Nothophytophthora sp. Chile5]